MYQDQVGLNMKRTIIVIYPRLALQRGMSYIYDALFDTNNVICYDGWWYLHAQTLWYSETIWQQKNLLLSLLKKNLIGVLI